MISTFQAVICVGHTKGREGRNQELARSSGLESPYTSSLVFLYWQTNDTPNEACQACFIFVLLAFFVVSFNPFSVLFQFSLVIFCFLWIVSSYCLFWPDRPSLFMSQLSHPIKESIITNWGGNHYHLVQNQMCAYKQAVGPMTTGPLNPANGWESARQILFRVRRYSFLPRVKLLQNIEKNGLIGQRWQPWSSRC